MAESVARFDTEGRTFVLDAVRSYARGDDPPRAPANASWVDSAHDAGVLAAVSSVLVENAQPIPAAAREHRVMSVAVEMAALQDLQYAGAVLAASGVRHALMKGPLLSVLAYRTSRARVFSDLDFLVSPRSFDAATRALIAAGATPVRVNWDQMMKGRTAEIGLVLPGGTLLDLHWSIFNLGDVRRHYPHITELLLESSVNQNLRGISAWSLSDIDMCVHVLTHGCLSGADKLRWLLDGHQALSWLGPRVELLAERAGELGLLRPASAMVNRICMYLDAGVANSMVMDSRSVWAQILLRVGGKCPPAPLVSRRTGRTWFSSTRPRTRDSLLQAASVRLDHMSRSGKLQSAPRNEPMVVGGAQYADWLALTLPEASQR